MGTNIQFWKWQVYAGVSTWQLCFLHLLMKSMVMASGTLRPTSILHSSIHASTWPFASATFTLYAPNAYLYTSDNQIYVREMANTLLFLHVNNCKILLLFKYGNKCSVLKMTRVSLCKHKAVMFSTLVDEKHGLGCMCFACMLPCILRNLLHSINRACDIDCVSNNLCSILLTDIFCSSTFISEWQESL